MSALMRRLIISHYNVYYRRTKNVIMLTIFLNSTLTCIFIIVRFTASFWCNF